ncbi:MAG: VOC family protein [Caulobacteraceae bacterium]|nr:VOC family protein [Caulobacteraceae bacterium]
MSLPLLQNHFQIAYVVRDVQASMRRLADQFGVARWYVEDMQALHGPEAPIAFIGLAYAGEVMLELIEARPGRQSIYLDWLPEAEDGLKLHHLGFLSPSEADFRARVEQLNAAGYPTAAAGAFGDILDFHYADTTPVFGHYHELIRLKAEGEAYFAKAPRN